MNLRQIETLVWIARLGGFGAAANQMHTTQPAISKRIQELEKELGVVLIDRNQRRMHLTPKGRECLAYAEQILASVADLRRHVSPRSQMSGRVSLGVSELIAQTWLSTLLCRLAEEIPGLAVDPTMDMTPSLLQGLRDRDFDVVLVGGIDEAIQYPSIELGFSLYAWMAKPGLENFSKPLTPRDLQSKRLLIWNKQAGIYRHIEEWFVRHGAFPKDKVLCNTTISIATLTIAGLGVGLLPVDLFRNELDQEKLCIVPTVPEFGPVQYQAIYVPSLWSPFGRIVAEVAADISSFQSHPRERRAAGAPQRRKSGEAAKVAK